MYHKQTAALIFIETGGEWDVILRVCLFGPIGRHNIQRDPEPIEAAIFLSHNKLHIWSLKDVQLFRRWRCDEVNTSMYI